LQARSSTQYRSHSSAARENVTPVRTIPGSVPACAWASTSASHASAPRRLTNPSAGRPGRVHTGAIFFCTCRPSGSRYFAYQTGPLARSFRNTCPLIERATNNRSYDTNNHPLGTYRGHIRYFEGGARTKETRHLPGFSSCPH
jgi:hypothetical protein